jgi:hypothetical protein
MRSGSRIADRLHAVIIFQEGPIVVDLGEQDDTRRSGAAEERRPSGGSRGRLKLAPGG